MGGVIYVLLIVSRVYGGVVVHTHEFSDKAACELAKETVPDLVTTIRSVDYGTTAAICVPKALSK